MENIINNDLDEYNYCSRKKCGKIECKRNIIHSIYKKNFSCNKYYNSHDCLITNKMDKHSIKIVEDDIKNADADIIAHQVNCVGVMGSGVAKVLRTQYPEIFPPYDKYCKLWGHSKLMGKIQTIKLKNENSKSKYICNMFAQRGYGRDKQYTDIDCLANCIFKIHNFAKENNLKTIAMPFGVGCGRGGADWNLVYEILLNVFSDDIQLILYKKVENL